MSKLPDSDSNAIAGLLSTFLRSVSFERGEHPRYADLRALFTPPATLIRAIGPTPEIWTVDEFTRAREASFQAGEVTSFEETEVSGRTELFGNIAHRFSAYAKRGATDSGPIDARGAISTQFVRASEGWRISSMIWDDERPA